MKRASLPPVLRIQRICALLNRARAPIPVHVIADRLEVSPKTVQRDIDFMKDSLELPIISCAGKGQRLIENIALCRCCAGRINK